MRFHDYVFLFLQIANLPERKSGFNVVADMESATTMSGWIIA